MLSQTIDYFKKEKEENQIEINEISVKKVIEENVGNEKKLELPVGKKLGLVKQTK